MGIRRGTLAAWKKKYSTINDNLKKNKAVIDYEVENALLKRALGYEYEEIRKEATTYYLNEGEPVELPADRIVTTKKEVVADTTAIIFWLKNRRPDLWRDKQSIEHSGQLGVTLEEHLNKVADKNEY